MAVLCTNCSGKLIFNPATQKLECVSCGSRFAPEDVEDKNAELHSKYYDTRVYTCSHCGAEVVTSDTEVSTFCVYCGNPAIVFNRIAKELRPDGLIPFKITKEEAVGIIKSRFFKNIMVPNEVKLKATTGNLRGIYVPYWVVNADFTDATVIKGEVKKGKHTYTEYYSRAGDVQFKNLPVDGSKTLNDDISAKLEPFYLEDSKAFDEDYLNGFYSNVSDLNYFDLKASAANRCHNMFVEEVMAPIKAKNKKVDGYIYWIDIHDDPIYMMMPVWFFTFMYRNKPYTILINGQTGKLVGTMPWIKKRIVLIGLGIFVALLAVTFGLFFGGFMHQIYATVMLSPYVLGAIITLGAAGLGKGISGIKKVWDNLKLTQSEDIFKFVKRRQE